MILDIAIQTVFEIIKDGIQKNEIIPLILILIFVHYFTSRFR